MKAKLKLLKELESKATKGPWSIGGFDVVSTSERTKSNKRKRRPKDFYEQVGYSELCVRSRAWLNNGDSISINGGDIDLKDAKRLIRWLQSAVEHLSQKEKAK